MADIDTKVLYLETPSVSAPPAAYTIGVRMKNVGLHDRATAGYVQVFRKATGLLEKTFTMASAVIEPDEEKQAFSTETWDLREEDPGTEFIVSGAITSDGDMDASNDILNPTTVTVVDEPPPPPPPVASHSSQHEDGGSDELNLDGLHGVPADPIPYANHAPKHQDGGDDELSLGSMSGQLQDPQIPTDHGNERHVEDFALVSVLNNHLSDATPHDAALETPEVVQAGEAPSKGPSSSIAPAEHDHGGHGGLDWLITSGLSGPGPHTILNAWIGDGCLHSDGTPFTRAVVRVDVYGDVTDSGGPGSTLAVELAAGPNGPTLVLRGQVLLPLAAPCTNGHFRVHFVAALASGSVDVGSHGLHCQTGGGGTALTPILTTAGISFTTPQLWRVRVGITGTAVVGLCMASTVLETIKKTGP